MSRSKWELYSRPGQAAATFDRKPTYAGFVTNSKEETDRDEAIRLACQEEAIVKIAQNLGRYNGDGFSVETGGDEDVAISLYHELSIAGTSVKVPVTFELEKPGLLIVRRPGVIDSDIEFGMTPKYGVRGSRRYLFDRNGKSRLYQPAINYRSEPSIKVYGEYFTDSEMSKRDFNNVSIGLNVIQQKLQSVIAQGA